MTVFNEWYKSNELFICINVCLWVCKFMCMCVLSMYLTTWNSNKNSYKMRIVFACIICV